MEAWRAELYHHGIKGQRWGVRKGPPYPLNAQDHTAAERRAGWRSSLNKNTSSQEKSSSSNERKEKPKQMSSETKQILTATATVAALGVIGAVAVGNPKVRSLAITGAKAAENVFTTKSEDLWLDMDLQKAWRLQAKTRKSYDPDFEKGWQKAMREMEATDKRAKKAQARNLKNERRAQRKANDEFLKSLQKAQNEAIKAQQRESERQKRIDIVKSHQGTNRFGDLMISDLLLMTV